MSITLPSEAVEVARAAVLDAVTVCREAARRLATVGRMEKADESPVTVADFAAQAVIVRRVGSSRVDLQACKLEYSIVSPK